MPDKPWKQLERAVAHLLGGRRYAANTGGRVDVESAQYVAQVKLVKTLSLASLESLALGMEQVGLEKGKAGLVLIKRRGGRGIITPLLVCMTETTWRQLTGVLGDPTGESLEGVQNVEVKDDRSGEGEPA